MDTAWLKWFISTTLKETKQEVRNPIDLGEFRYDQADKS